MEKFQTQAKFQTIFEKIASKNFRIWTGKNNMVEIFEMFLLKIHRKIDNFPIKRLLRTLEPVNIKAHF